MATGTIKKPDNTWVNIGSSLPFTIPSNYTEIYIYGQIQVSPMAGYRLGAMLPAMGGTLRQEASMYIDSTHFGNWSIIKSGQTISKTDVSICGTAYDYTDAFSYINIMAK